MMARHRRQARGRSSDPTARMVRDLRQLRRQIDQLDRQVVRILSRRASLAVRAGRLKRRQGRPIFDRVREMGVLRQVQRSNRGPLPAAALRVIYRTILRANRSLGMAMSTRGHKVTRGQATNVHVTL